MNEDKFISQGWECPKCGAVKYNATIHGIDGEYVEVAEKWNRRVDDERED